MIGGVEEFSDSKVKDTNILVFAFVGDSVYTTFIRSKVSSVSYSKSGKLNALTNKYICALGQSVAYDFILPMLNEREFCICNTARNTQTKNVAKHATLENYKKATSFESLIGYLYLTDQKERLDEILNLSYNKVREYYESRR